MTEEQEKSQEGSNGKDRDETGKFVKGNHGGPGGPKLTEEQKAVKRALRELVADYKEGLAQILPQISPIVIDKALKGDMQAIKEIHSIVVGQAPKELNLGQIPELPFTIIVKKDDRESENS